MGESRGGERASVNYPRCLGVLFVAEAGENQAGFENKQTNKQNIEDPAAELIM